MIKRDGLQMRVATHCRTIYGRARKCCSMAALAALAPSLQARLGFENDNRCIHESTTDGGVSDTNTRIKSSTSDDVAGA